MWRLNGCPKCGGDLFVDGDGKWTCLQCGGNDNKPFMTLEKMINDRGLLIGAGHQKQGHSRTLTGKIV